MRRSDGAGSSLQENGDEALSHSPFREKRSCPANREKSIEVLQDTSHSPLEFDRCKLKRSSPASIAAMHTQVPDLPLRTSPSPSKARDGVFQEFIEISSAPQVYTDAPMVAAIRKAYPELHLTSSDASDFLGFAAAGQASAIPVDSEGSMPPHLTWKQYYATRRLDGGVGGLADDVQFGKYMYTWQEKEFILYVVLTSHPYYPRKVDYLLGPAKEITEACLLAACQYSNELHDQVWVFDRGRWQKNAELWQSVKHASWDDVILEEGMKKSIMEEINRFFDSRERYQRLKVPWKRGVIYYGPPGKLVN